MENIINKENKFLEFLKKEYVLTIALILAVVTSFISKPKVEYIDFKVLILLFNLMIVIAAFNKLKVLDYIAVSILNKCASYRGIVTALVFITFIASMFVTNDVALITFVPITLIISSKINIKVLNLVVLQTLAANLGSSLTPMGNPQNLFLYTFYDIDPLVFLKIMIPVCILAVLFLLALIFKEKDIKLNLQLDKSKVNDKQKFVCFSILLILILLSVFHVIDYKIVFVITIISVGILDNKLFLKVDYSLLLTFVCFFIFIGNISNMNNIKAFMENILLEKENTYYVGVLASQVISNVPATMLLSGFTDHFKELLLGVNIGGMGTLIASLASVISYKLYCNQYDDTKEYIKIFTIYNIIGLALFTVAIKILI